MSIDILFGRKREQSSLTLVISERTTLKAQLQAKPVLTGDIAFFLALNSDAKSSALFSGNLSTQPRLKADLVLSTELAGKLTSSILLNGLAEASTSIEAELGIFTLISSRSVAASKLEAYLDTAIRLKASLEQKSVLSGKLLGGNNPYSVNLGFKKHVNGKQPVRMLLRSKHIEVYEKLPHPVILRAHIKGSTTLFGKNR